MFNRNKDDSQIVLPFIKADVTRQEAADLKEVERSFARIFASDDGQRVMAYLQSVTFQRALGAEATHSQLRHLEGQRALVASMLRLIARGREN